MRTLLLVILAVAVSCFTIQVAEDTPNDVNWPFVGCNADALKFTNLTLTAQPSKGKNTTAHIMGTAVSAVNLKEVDVGLTFNAGPVNVEFLPWVTKLAAGAPVNYNYTFFVPDYYRTGKYTYTVSFVDEKDGIAGCLRFSFSI